MPQGGPVDPPPAPLLAGLEITTLFEDSAGRIWAGTNRGFGYFDGMQYVPVRDAPVDGVESLFEDSRHRIWAAISNSALVVVEPSRTTVLDTRQGLPGYPLYRLLEDTFGSFWVSSPRGLLQFREGDLADVLDGRRSKLSLMHHALDDGMRTIECHGLSQPSGSRDRYGNLWFPTAKGFVEVRPRPLTQRQPPVARVEQVAVDGTMVPSSSETRIAAEARSVEIRYSAVRLSVPHEVQFRYRLNGFDPDWVDAGVERTARYSRLSPGLHSFQVQARDAWASVATRLRSISGNSRCSIRRGGSHCC